VPEDGNVPSRPYFSSNFRDQYIIKKYIGKHWVASPKVPNLPLGKSYYDQEMRVIECVSSGKFGLQLCADPTRYSHEYRTKPLTMLKRSEQEQSFDEINGAELEGTEDMTTSCFLGKSDAERNHSASKTISAGRRWLSREATIDPKNALISHVDASPRLSFNRDAVSSHVGPAAQFPHGPTSIFHFACIQNGHQQPFKPCVDTELRFSDSESTVMVRDVSVQTE
jgi:hypothetical protein